MKPSEALNLHRDEIRSIVEKNGACNPRVFGSVLHGEDTEASDIDLIVDSIDGKTTLLSLFRIKQEVESITGFEADIVTPRALKEAFRSVVLSEAVAL